MRPIWFAAGWIGVCLALIYLPDCGVGFIKDDYNWIDPWFGTPSPSDLGGHGTHTTGTMIGRGGIGVAQRAHMLELGRRWSWLDSARGAGRVARTGEPVVAYDVTEGAATIGVEKVDRQSAIAVTSDSSTKIIANAWSSAGSSGVVSDAAASETSPSVSISASTA